MQKAFLLFISFSWLLGPQCVHPQQIQQMNNFQQNNKLLFDNEETHNYSLLSERVNIMPKDNIFSIDKAIVWQPDTVIVYDKYTLQGRYTYDNIGNNIIQVYSEWIDSSWSIRNKMTFNYNDSGNILSETYAYWSSNIWVNSEQNTYTYDGDGNLSILLKASWDNNDWSSFYRYTYTYDDNGNMLTNLWEIRESNSWSNFYRYTYTYDYNGNMLTSLTQRWFNETWENKDRSSFEYNDNNCVLSELAEEWESGTWNVLYRGIFSYDIYNNNISQLYEIWSNNTWNNFGKYLFTYDSDSNLLTKLLLEWVEAAWSNTDRITYYYDNNGNSIAGKVETFQSGMWQPANFDLSLFSNFNLLYNYYEIYRYEACFKDASQKIIDSEGFFNIELFPNPVTDNLNIILQHPQRVMFKIYNINGQCVLDGYLDTFISTINTIDLTSGIYIISLESIDGNLNIKFIKQ